MSGILYQNLLGNQIYN